AKDWPQVNFVSYHAALRSFLETPDAALAEFEQTGRIKWATDLAEIPAKYGVTNVYGELGTAFANSAVANPRFAAAFIGTLVRGWAPTTSSGAATRCGTGRPSGRSRRCAVWRSPMTCRRSTVSPRSVPPMGSSRPRSSAATPRGSTSSTYAPPRVKLLVTRSRRSRPSTSRWAAPAPTPGTGTSTGRPRERLSGRTRER